MEKISIFEYADLPEHIKKSLIEYYEGTDHRAILNGSYTRFPYLFDFPAADETDYYLDLDGYFLQSGATIEEGYVIIHWEW